MTQQPMAKPDPNEIDALMAAHNLNLRLGRGVAYWSRFLANNRRPDRATVYRIPFKRVGRSATYQVNDLAAFASSRRDRLQASEAKRPKDRTARTSAKNVMWTVETLGRTGENSSPVLLRGAGLALSIELTAAQARALAQQLLEQSDSADQAQRLEK